MLNDPTYKTLVRHFWVRAHIYDRNATKLEETEKVLIDPSMEGKSREEMGLEPFRCTEIRSSTMGIPVFISEEIISFVIRRSSEGNYKGGIGNNKTSPWNEVVNKTMFSSSKKGAYSDLSMENKMLLKIQNENLLPKGGGSNQPSLEHRIFLHFFIKKEKANVLKYIFKHMMKELKEIQDNKRCWDPYGRLISEILHQGGILKALSNVNFFTDEQLDTETGKIINGRTLRNMNLIGKEVYTKLNTYLKEPDAMSNLMDDFPPICKQDPIDVQMNFIKDHFATTGNRIRLEDVPETMYGGALPVAKSRKTKRKALTKDEYLVEAPEPAPKKVKKSKAASQEQLANPEVLTIQQEAQDLDASEVLDKRTKSSKPADVSQISLPQSSIPKKKRKLAIRQLREASLAEEEQQEAATSLVTREIMRKRVEEEAVVKKALEIAAEISVPSEVLLKETSIKDAQAGIELTKNLQQLVVSGELLKDSDEVQEENVVGSEAATSEAAASEAIKGNPESLHPANVIKIESGSESYQTLTSSSTYTSDSSELDDVPLNKLYKNLSPSTKLKKNASDEPFEPLYSSVLNRIGEMSQMRVDLCAKLPADRALQPLVVEPLNVAPTDAETIGEQAGYESTNLVETSSSQPKSPTKISEPSALENLVSHYSGELPEVESELQKASEVASDKVASESPQQQTPNLQTASTTIPTIPDHIESLSCSEQVSEPEASDMEVEMSKSSFTFVPDNLSETNTPTIPTNNQPSTSNLAIQPTAPPRTTKVPSPPTMYLDSSLLADVCENIFQELNRLIHTSHDLIHENSYEKTWKRLKERVDNVLTALQRICIDDQDTAQQKLQD